MADSSLTKKKPATVSTSRPPQARYLDLPVVSFADWSTVSLVNLALNEHDEGQFRASSLLCDSFLKDDRISSVIGTRINSLLGSPLEFDEGDKKGPKAKVTRELEDCWDDMFPADQLAELLRWGIFNCVAPAQLLWETRDGRWLPKLQTWHPQTMHWRWDTRSYWVSAQGGPENYVELDAGAGTWLLYTPRGFQRGWIHGAVRALATPWIIRRWAYRDWARYSEVHGLPIKKAVVPAEAEEKHKERFLREVAALGVESAVRIEKAVDGSTFDLELIEAVGNTWEGFDRLLDKTEASMAITILGQNLTTEVKGGSFAAAKVQDRVRSDYLAFDAKSLMRCLREQVLKPWALYNFGDAELAPKPRWVTEPAEDKKNLADSINSLGTGVTALRAAGANVDVVKICDQFDVPLVEGQPLKEPDPPPPAPGDRPAPFGKTAPEKKSEQSKRALLKPEVTAQLYIDQVGDGGVLSAAATLKPDLRELLNVVEGAESYEQLREQLVTAFGKMQPSALAALMRRALVLAELSGRHAVLQEL